MLKTKQQTISRTVVIESVKKREDTEAGKTKKIPCVQYNTEKRKEKKVKYYNILEVNFQWQKHLLVKA